MKNINEKAKVLVFDMDGVTVGLYNVEDWLPMLRAENPLPYEIAKPLVDMVELRVVLMELKKQGWHIAITSWLSKGASFEYDNKVRQAKKDWLDKYNFPYDELHFLRYGTTKANATRAKGGYQILIDDNEKIRGGWRLGATIDGAGDFITALKKLGKVD